MVMETADTPPPDSIVVRRLDRAADRTGREASI